MIPIRTTAPTRYPPFVTWTVIGSVVSRQRRCSFFGADGLRSHFGGAGVGRVRSHCRHFRLHHKPVPAVARHRRSADLLLPLFFEVHAFVFIGLWFLLQILQETIALLEPSEGGVASISPTKAERQESRMTINDIFAVARYIDVNDSEDVLRAIQMTDGDLPLDIILHTPGGLVPAALRIA
jgi:hypothetical protein